MELPKSLCAVVALLCIAHCSLIPSEQEMLEAKVLVDNLIDNNIINTNERFFIAGLVRLAFHDCVGAGGCDGCIDHNNPSNGGLKTYTVQLDPVYDGNVKDKLSMSRADFYMLAGYVALQKASEGLDDQFTAFPQFGRLDCSISPDEDVSESFPEGDSIFYCSSREPERFSGYL